jgi:acyl carrier protein
VTLHQTKFLIGADMSVVSNEIVWLLKSSLKNKDDIVTEFDSLFFDHKMGNIDRSIFLDSIEEHFTIEIPRNRLDPWDELGEIIDYVSSQVSKRRGVDMNCLVDGDMTLIPQA